ncbi:hypothetical protein MTR67_009238 [Solanum verrucosum]|uniref:non-specific serine/threonine protein kinase n=1 Tax=Solanum verrucosum TaxID=315347 RepID=A0AAF0Q3K1_SOLVR|nr:hypothetical protein MTR67_009238 [Solanum verrucosum]
MKDASGGNEDVEMDVWVLGPIGLKMRISGTKVTNRLGYHLTNHAYFQTEVDSQLDTHRYPFGFFGEVFRGIWNGTEVAVKVFLEQELTEENIEDFANEISILSRIRHPNVILFLGACTTPPRLSVVTEFMEMGSLYHLIHVSGQKNNLSWQRRLKMICDICSLCTLGLGSSKGLGYPVPCPRALGNERFVRNSNVKQLQAKTLTKCLKGRWRIDNTIVKS